MVLLIVILFSLAFLCVSSDSFYPSPFLWTRSIVRSFLFERKTRSLWSIKWAHCFQFRSAEWTLRKKNLASLWQLVVKSDFHYTLKDFWMQLKVTRFGPWGTEVLCKELSWRGHTQHTHIKSFVNATNTYVEELFPHPWLLVVSTVLKLYMIETHGRC